MNIIIAGAGKVGFNLAKTLCIGHNVTIIDKNSEALHRIQESLDILPIMGNVEDSGLYESFLDKKIDLFIAVTNVDNVNLLSSLVAQSVLEIDRKFVRLHNHFFKNQFLQDKLSIDKMIFPTQLASRAIVSLLNYPKANNVKFFKYTDFRLISFRAPKNLEPIELIFDNVAVVGIERDKSFFIPEPDQYIYPNDLIYFFGLEDDIDTICDSLSALEKTEIKRCVVLGANELGVCISKELIDAKKDVKLIDGNLVACEDADESLGGQASVIHLKYGDTTIFQNENLDKADIFISATNNDEYNIIKCLEAQENGISKVVAINNEMEYYSLMHSLGIIVVRGPKISAYNTIMEHISSNGVVIEKSFCGLKAMIYMRKIFPNSSLILKKKKPLSLKKTKIFYMRDSRLELFDEKMVLKEGDLLIAFCGIKESAKVKQWIYGL